MLIDVLIMATAMTGGREGRRAQLEVFDAPTPLRPPARSHRRRARSLPWAQAPVTRAGKLVPLDLKAGDRVLFGKWSGTEVKIDGEDLLIMNRRHGRDRGRKRHEEEGGLRPPVPTSQTRNQTSCLQKTYASLLTPATA